MIRISTSKARHMPDTPLVIENLETGETLPVRDFDVTSLVWHLAGSGCECGESDGSVDCDCGTTMEFFEDALEWIDHNDGEVFEDPGYFYFY